MITSSAYSACIDDYSRMSSATIVVTADTLLAGFDQAHARARSAAGGLDWSSMYFAVFETLNWAAALDDRLGEPRSGIQVEDDHLSGLRYVRNRTHHQWANAFLFDTGVTAVIGHMQVGRGQPDRGHPSITWRPVTDLPRPSNPAHDNKKFERAYARSLEGGEVSQSLEVIAKGLAAAVASAP